MKRHARLDLEQPDLIELLSLDDAGFKRSLPARLFYAPNAAAAANVCGRARKRRDQTALPILDARLMMLNHSLSSTPVGRLNKSNRRYEKDNHLRPHPDGLSTTVKKSLLFRRNFQQFISSPVLASVSYFGPHRLDFINRDRGRLFPKEPRMNVKTAAIFSAF